MFKVSERTLNQEYANEDIIIFDEPHKEWYDKQKYLYVNKKMHTIDGDTFTNIHTNESITINTKIWFKQCETDNWIEFKTR